jgi:hypothetical protein
LAQLRGSVVSDHLVNREAGRPRMGKLVVYGLLGC